MRDITVYSKTSCAYCALAKQLLKDRSLVFHEIDITAKPDTAHELVARTGQRTVPQIFIGDRFIGGYTELAALLTRPPNSAQRFSPSPSGRGPG